MSFTGPGREGGLLDGMELSGGGGTPILSTDEDDHPIQSY